MIVRPASSIRSFRHRPPRKQHSPGTQRRRAFAELLEPRRLLAGDVELGPSPENAPLISLVQPEGEALPELPTGFGSSLREAISEISRVLGAITQSPTFEQVIPILGDALPVDVGGTSIIDTDTVSTLFQLSERFEQDVAGPLRSHLDANPLATPNELISQFDFLEALEGPNGNESGVKLNLDFSEQLQKPLESLLRPLTQFGGPFQAITGDALADVLNVEISTEDLGFQVFLDGDDQLHIEVPNFSLNIGNADLGIAELAGQIGLLAGSVFDPQIDLDLGWRFDAGSLFGGGLGALDPLSFDQLQSITANDIIAGFRAESNGSGLHLNLPFEFELPGFDTDGLFPQLVASDSNPLDDLFPVFEILIPEGAPYDLDSILGLVDLTPSEMLALLENLGDVFQQIQDGSLLDVKIPFANDVTVGEALGLAESYASGVLNFLRTGEGLPQFGSIQELMDLIPGVSDFPSGPTLPSPVRYNAETKTLDISLDFVRDPDPIFLQSDLNVFAGSADRPFAELLIDDIDPDTGEPDETLNRLQITRNASLGLDLQIDLSLDRDESIRREFESYDHSLDYRVRPWTRLDEFAQRFGFADEMGLRAIADVVLQDGTTGVLDFGILDPSRTLGDLIETAKIVGGVDRIDPDGATTRSSLLTQITSDAWQIIDLTTGSNTTTITPQRTPDTAHAFWDNLFGNQAVAFNQLESTSGVFDSRILRGSFLDGHLTPTSGGDSETPLRWLFPVAGPFAGLTQELQPITAHLRDGRDVTISFTDLDAETVESLLPTLSAELGGEPVIEAVIENERIVLRDLTEPSGGRRFRLSFADESGWSVLRQILDVGEDDDRDGQLVGPRLLPVLTNDLRPSVTEDTRLVDLAAQYGVDPELPDSLTITYRDGRTNSITSAQYVETETLGSLIDFFNDDNDDSILGLVDGRLSLFDFTDGPDGVRTFLEATPGGLFARMFDAPQHHIDLDYDRVIRSRTLTTNGVSLETPVLDLLPSGLDLRNAGVVRVDLSNGDHVVLPPLSLAEGATVADVVDQWSFINESFERVLAAKLIDGRIELQDLTQAEGGNQFRVRVSGSATVEGTFLKSSVDEDGDGRIAGAEIRQAIPDVQEAPVKSVVNPRVPVWTKVSTLVDRYDLREFTSGFENLRVALRDGTQVDFSTLSDGNSTLDGLIRGSARYRSGQLIAELKLEDGRLELHDYTTGTGELSFTTNGQEGIFFATVFAESTRESEPGVWRSQPLGETILNDIGSLVSLGSIIGDSFHPLLGTPTNPALSSAIEYSLSDGSKHETGLFGNFGLDLRRYLEQLTIREDGEVLVQPMVVDGRIVLVDQTEGEHIFSARAISPAADQLHRRLLPLKPDIDGNGELVGPSLLPSLPTVNDPIRDTIKLRTLLESIAGPELASRAASTTASVRIQLRDGSAPEILTIEPLDENATLADLLPLLRIERVGEGTVFEVELVDGRLMAVDHTTPGTNPVFTISDVDFDTNNLITTLGLSHAFSDIQGNPLPADVGHPGLIEGTSLYEVVDATFLTIGSLQPGEISNNSSLTLNLRDGTTEIVSVGTITDQDDLLQVISRLNVQRGSETIVQATYESGRVVLEDLTTETGEHEFSIDFGDTTFTYPTSLFLPLSRDLDDDGRIVGARLFSSLSTEVTGPESRLADLAGRFGLPEVQDVDDVVVEITLRNGLQVTQPLAVHPGMTLREFLSQMEIVEETPDGTNILFAADVVNINGGAELAEAPRWRVILRDLTESVDGTGETQVRRLEDQEDFGSLLPTFLGIYGRDVNNTGVIVGGSMETVDDSERVRIKLTEPPTLAASIEAVATNVRAAARIGGLASANLSNGQGLAAATVQIQVLPPIGRDYVTTRDLLGALTGRNDLLQIQLDTDLQFSGELALDLGGLNEQFESSDEVPRVEIAWPDFLTSDPSVRLQTDTLDVNFVNAENLFQLKDLTLQDITNLIRKVVDLVERISGEDLLYRRLPLVNTSIGEALDTVDAIDALVQQTIEDPDATLKSLETLLEDSLGLNDDQLTLSYDAANNAIKIELDLELNAPFQSSLNLDLADVGLAGLDQLVDFQASGAIQVDANAMFDLDLGISLDALGIQRLREAADEANPNLPPSANFDDVILVYGTTGVSASARAAATDLEFNTAIGPLAVDVGPGVAVLDADGLAFGGTGTNDPAQLEIRLPDPNVIYGFTSLSPDEFTVDFQASAGLDLPLTFTGLDGPTTQQLQLHWPNINVNEVPSFSTVTTIDTAVTSPNGGRQIVLPDLQAAIGEFDASDSVFALVAGLEGLFGLIEGYLGDEILGIPVPVIGDGLSAATGFLNDLRAELSGAVESQGTTADLARAAIYQAIGPSGLNVLQDLNLDGLISIEDVVVTPPSSGSAPLAEGEGNEIFYRLQLGGTFEAVDTGIDLDVGVPALGLEIGGDLGLDVGWQVDVGFGISQMDGVFVQFFGDDEIKLGFEASVDDLQATGRIGPVAITASTIDANDLTADQRTASLLDPSDPQSETINALAGRFNIDLGNGRVGLTNLGSYLQSLPITTEATLAGSLHLDLLTGLETNAQLPGISTGLHITWPSQQGPLLETISALASPQIEFSDVSLDLGSFISDILGPTLGPVNDMIDPIRPILDALTTPIPVISDLAGEVTFVDLMGLFGSGGESVAKFVEAAATIADLINVPIVNGNVRIPLGSFTTAFSDAEGEGSGQLVVSAAIGGQSLDQFVDGLPQDDEVGGYLRNLPEELSLPILENPASAIQLLLGNDVTLVEYDVPRLEASFGYTQYFPIFPIFGITVGGELSIAADFAFGYDTYGIRQFAESNRIQDLFNGFFLSDRIFIDEDGNEVDPPEVEFEAALLAGGELNVLIASAGVEGGLFAGIDLNLNDPNEDGKIRAGELLDNLSLGNHPLLGPLWVFDASGKLEVGLRAYVEAPLLKEKELDLGRFTILDFNIPRPSPSDNDPQLATLQSDGTLLLHAGPNAALRENGNTSDGDEEFFIDASPTGGVTVSAFGVEATYEDAQRVFVDLGQGSDSLTIGESLTLPVEALGGAGDDVITGGGGALTAMGGPGNDILMGSFVADLLDGGDGNDEIDAKAGDDIVRGGDGDDDLRGAAGIDRIDAGPGNDDALGGFGADFIIGGPGSDFVDGGEGDDVIFGDSEGSVDNPASTPESSSDGDDVLLGDLGSDLIVGSGGNDQLTGGAGSDGLFAGGGNDLVIAANQPPSDQSPRGQQLFLGGEQDDFEPHMIDAGLGDDLVFGSSGDDTVSAAGGLNIIRTYGGNDIITTGAGNDLIESGSGDDIVDAGNGANEVSTGAGYDEVTTGTGNDLIDLRGSAPGGNVGGRVDDAGGNNRVYGDRGDDVFVLLSGNNVVHAGDGNNEVRTGPGNDLIVTNSGNDLIDAGDGNNDITSGGGDDTVTSGSGDDHVNSGPGDDFIESGNGDDVVKSGSGNDIVLTLAGDDIINTGSGDDYVVAGRGNDRVETEAGDDIVWAGLEFYTQQELQSNLIVPAEFALHGTYTGFVAPAIEPAIVGGQSIGGEIQDGDDFVFAGDGFDLVFGGGGDDTLDGGPGHAYLDGGAGADIITGGDGVDLIRGGEGDDTARGGAGIDLLFGNEGSDDLLGESGVLVDDINLTFGQMLFGGPGNDTLLAWSSSSVLAVESSLRGDRLDGGEGVDLLRGNIRQEVLLGGPGDDILSGDRLTGPGYVLRPETDDPRLTGANDILFGGGGDDQLFGHGGDDELWGGADSDALEGHAGVDRSYGGTGIDFMYLEVGLGATVATETLDGFFGNESEADVPNDNSTDILVIPGTPGGDTITLGGSGQNLLVNYNGLLLTQAFRDGDGNATVQQFQIDALGGNDDIRFLDSLDLGDLAQRSRDWVGVINGGSGDDIIRGSTGRDRISGGPGSDRLFGLAGDDRLWGDDQDGNALDNDTLFGGPGNDDLIGGVGRNEIYAWSDDPLLGTAFGRFVDPSTGVTYDSPGAGRELEDTGLNRMLGRDQADLLYAGTGLDFMYGGGDFDILHDVNGQPLETGFGVPDGDLWLDYARSTDKVWYYGGTSGDDVITVDYVTEPGVLGDHHLITRLTENNGLFTFDARVQLDFGAVDEEGQLIWDPNDLVYRLEELQATEDADARQLIQSDIELTGGLLPPEGDFLAIIIDAKAGDDEINVGPTVQRTVWVSAGEGDDEVRIDSGTALLVDLADSGARNDVPGAPGDPSRAYRLGPVPGAITETTLFTDLTLDSPADVDWYELDFQTTRFMPDGAITVDSVAPTDSISISIWELEPDGFFASLGPGVTPTLGDSLDPRKPARVTMPLGGFNMDEDFRYFIRVESDSEIPTLYDLGIDFGDGAPLGLQTVNLGVAPEADFLRRDVIVGGPGDDILQGGPSEDWVIGGEGADILSGGFDRGASDIIIGEAGNDLFQVLLDDAPFDDQGSLLNLTLADQFEGGEGFDRVLIQGGDVDSSGNPIPDHLTLSYTTDLGAVTLAGRVWDTTNQQFLRDGDQWVIQTAKYQTRGVEGTWFDLRDGDDELRLDDGYQFPGADPQDPSYGISPGHRPSGAASFSFEIEGGPGSDRLIGSPYADWIDAGAGFDFVSGGGGDDTILGGSGGDLLVGGGTSFTPQDHLETSVINGNSVRNDAAIDATLIQFNEGPLADLSFHEGDVADWYVVPRPSGGPLQLADLEIDFGTNTRAADAFAQSWNEPLVTVTPAVMDPVSGGYRPTFANSNAQYFLLGITNPRSRAMIGETPPSFEDLPATRTLELFLDLDNGRRRSGLGIQVSSATSGPDAATLLNTALEGIGFDDEVFAEYDAVENRLMLVMRQSGVLRINGNVGDPERLGFTNSQTNQGSPTSLGTYTLISTATFSDPAAQPSTPYRMELATVNPDNGGSSMPLYLAEPTQRSLSSAMRVEGDTAFAGLQFSHTIGDVNGDGYDDLLIADSQTAYGLLGPVNVQAGASPINDVTDFRFDLSGNFNDGPWRIVPGSEDLDEDGRPDVAFYRITEDLNFGTFHFEVRVVTAADLSVVSDVNQTVDVETEGRLAMRLPVSRRESLDSISIAWMEYDSHVGGDLMVVAEQPIFTSQVADSHGGVFQGRDLTQAITTGPVVNQVGERWILPGGETETEIATLVNSKYTGVSASVPLTVRQRLRAIPMDVDGDGREEIALFRPTGWLFQNQSNPSDYLAVGRVYIVNALGNAFVTPGDVKAPAAIQLEASNVVSQPFDLRQLRHAAFHPTMPGVVADFNFDGRDALVIARDGSLDSREPDLLVFQKLEPGLAIQQLQDATHSFHNVMPDTSTIGSFSVGDFDGDHQQDLAISGDGEVPGSRGVRIIYDPLRGSSGDFDLSTSDSGLDTQRFQSLAPGDGLGVLAAHAGDFTGDGIDDIALGAPGFDAVAGSVETNAGAIFMLPGQRRPGTVPNAASAIRLENFNVRGLGGAVVDLESLVHFSARNAANPTDFELNAGGDSRLFRFQTVGDGAPGDVLRIGPGLGTDPRVAVWGQSTSLVPGSEGYYAAEPIVVGGTNESVGLISFDLGKILPTLVDASHLLDAELRLAASSSVNNTDVVIEFILGDGYGVFDDRDGEFTDQIPLFATPAFQVGKDQEVFEFDLADLAGGIESIQKLITQGDRYLTARIHVNTRGAEVTVQEPDRTLQEPTGLLLYQQPGAIGKLMDEEGRVLQANASGFDLRHLDAGVYFLEVTSADPSAQQGTIEFDLTFDAPSRGAFDPPTDRDSIRGGDGDDVIIGGPDRDALWGESGQDAFTAESFEPRDLEASERLREPSGADVLDENTNRLLDDPRVIVDPDPNEDPPRGVVEIENETLAMAMGDAIGVQLIPRADGTLDFARPVYASDFGAVTYLDLSNQEIYSLRGMEVLSNLVGLDLANNSLFTWDLDPLFPGGSGMTGVSGLQFLNLDGNFIDGIEGLAQLAQLEVLSLNFNSGEEGFLSDISALNQLHNLQFASFIEDGVQSLSGLFGVYLFDDNPIVSAINATHNGDWYAANSARTLVGDTYHYADARVDRPSVIYQTPSLDPGRYEVLASWLGHQANTSDALLKVTGGSGLSVNINQRVDPRGEMLGDHVFESLGFVDVDSTATLELRLELAANDGLLISDAFLLRRVDVTELPFETLDLQSNGLNEATRSVLLQSITDTFDTEIRITEADKPVWSGHPESLAGEVRQRIEWVPEDFVSVGADESYFIDEDPLSENLRAIGNQFLHQYLQRNSQVESAQVLVHARTGSGRVSTIVQTVGFGGSIAEGLFVDQSSTVGVAGSDVFADLNGSKELDPNTEPFTLTNLDGQFQLFVESGVPIQLLGELRSNDLSLQPTDGLSVQFKSTASVESGLVLGVAPAVKFDLPAVVNEGFEQVLGLESFVDVKSVLWSADSGSVLFRESTEPVTDVLFEDGGIFTVTGTVERASGHQHSLQRTIRVLDVAPIADAGPDTEVEEGRFFETREVVIDPGADSWEVTVDYGDGSDPVEYPASSDRTVDLDHVYTSPGRYIVSVTVTNDEGTSVDHFELRVRPSEALIDLNAVSDFGFVKGTEVGASIVVLDPTGQADRFGWSYVINWGDGTSESFAGLLEFDTGAGVKAVGVPTHVYEEKGHYEIEVLVTDDSGQESVEEALVTIFNDEPEISLTLSLTVLEDTALEASAQVTDLDEIASITWDFGDGSPLVLGSPVAHVYTQPGQYTVAVTALDSLGASTTVQQVVTVVNVVEPPVLEVVPRQLVTEQHPWSYQLVVSDPDAGQTGGDLVFELLEGSELLGLDLNPATGLVSWTPGADQGGQSYEVGVRVSKGSVHSEIRWMVDVLDTGAIQGRLFEDVSGNGEWNEGEPRLVGQLVGLDFGNDGTIDRTTQTDANGLYRFDSLPRGLYRVEAEFDSSWELTTPQQFLVDMEISESLTVFDMGGLADSDGDGVNNDDELNASAGADGNQDGIPDWQQGNVVSLDLPGGPVTIVSNLGTTLANVRVEDVIPGSPAESVLPLGRIHFDVAGLPSGGTAQVELIFGQQAGINAIFQVDEAAPIDEAFRLMGQDPDENVTVLEDRIVLGIPDGGGADLDAIANGTVANSFQPARVDDAWTNPADPNDVSGQDGVTALDALLVINALRRNSGTYELPASRPDGSNYLDVNGDGMVSALDALLVINQLRRDQMANSGNSSGEGEFAPRPSSDGNQSTAPPEDKDPRENDKTDPLDDGIGRLF